jgi:hypothetical protein
LADIAGASFSRQVVHVFAPYGLYQFLDFRIEFPLGVKLFDMPFEAGFLELQGSLVGSVGYGL